jgi:hypothetical protein
MLKSIRKNMLAAVLGGLIALGIACPCSKQPGLEERVAENLPGRIEFQPDYEKTLDRVIITYKEYPREVISVQNYYKFIRKEENDGISARKSLIENLPSYSRVFLICDKETEPLFKAELAKMSTSVQQRVSISIADLPFVRDAFSQDMGAGVGTNFILRKDYPYIASNLSAFGFNIINNPSTEDGWGNKLLARNKAGEKIVFIGSTLAETDSRNFRESKDYVREFYRQTFSADRAIIADNVNTHANLENRSIIHLDQVFSFGGDGIAFIARMPDRNPKVSKFYDGFLREFSRARNKNIDRENIMDYFALGNRFSAEGRQYIPEIYLMDSLREKLTESQFKVLQKYGNYLGLFYHEYVSRKIYSNEKILAENGFEVHPLKMDILNIAMRQSPLNMAVFTDGESGKKNILFPIFGPVDRYESKEDVSCMILNFPDSYTSSVSEAEGKFIPGVSAVYFGKKPRQELEQENLIELEKKGYRVRCVLGEDLTGGNLHCLMNPL